MKSMNSIFSSGALIFMLLVVGLDFAAAAGTIAHGAVCTAEDDCKDTGIGVRCRKGGDAGPPYKHGERVTDFSANCQATATGADQCKCVCQADDVFDSVSVKCYDPHGAECTADTDCKTGSLLTCGGKGALHERREEDYPGEALVGKGPGKCVCRDSKKSKYDIPTMICIDGSPPTTEEGTNVQAAACDPRPSAPANLKCKGDLKCVPIGDEQAKGTGQCYCISIGTPI